MSDLVRYDAMCSAISAAYSVDEVKDIRDKAVALEHYARQAKNVEAERQACEIRLRAERKAGALLKVSDKLKGRPAKASPKGTLSDVGISRKQSSNWQKLAAVPQDEFDRAITEADRPTTNGIIRATTQQKKQPVSNEALWLWGTLRDFEPHLTTDPAEFLETMTPGMKDDIHRLTSQVAAWLKRIGSIRP